MTTVSWDVPGPGAWELETTHAVRPATPWGAEAWQYGYVRGFRYGTARYGGLLDYLEPAVVNGFMYSQPRAYGAPAGAAGPPPLPVLWLLTRLVPKLRARIKLSEAAFATKLWRADLAEWDAVDRPDIVARHRGLQAIEPSSLTDAELADHLLESREHLKFSHWIHHKYSVPATLTAGDLLAGAMAWTGCGPGEILRLIRGNSDISLGFCADELGAAAMAIRSDAGAQAVLAGGGATCDAQQVLDELVAGTASGDAVAAYLEAVRYRGMGYDVGDKNAGEMPDVLLGAIRSAVEGAAPAPAEDTLVSRVRARVPEAHAADFDDRLAEARLMSRLRDERGAYSDGWATGLARRAILEAGRRLVATDRLADAEHAVDLSPDELVAMLRGGPGPAADEVAGRYLWRTTKTTRDAPASLGGTPSAPPPPTVLPRAARRAEWATRAIFENLFAGGDREPGDDAGRGADEPVVRGIPVHPGVYEGTARIVSHPGEFERIEQGDVLVAPSTSPYFNVVLPMLGAIVTDRGGALSHAAIVAREYGIPGVVGTREATTRIPEGVRVRVDGATGEVRFLA